MELETLGRIAQDFPQAIDVFERHGIDFCCRGGRSLTEACDAAGLDVQAVIVEIAAAAVVGEPWTGGDANALIDHILRVYHQPLEGDLDRLEKLAEKVARVHGSKHPHLVEVRGVLRVLAADLRQHMRKEEQVLFPMIRMGSPNVHRGPIPVMLHEHEEAGQLLQHLRELCGDYAIPEAACASWRALYSGVERLERDLHRHIHLENNVLFAMLPVPDPV